MSNTTSATHVLKTAASALGLATATFVAAASLAQANPEMNRCGQDITSGPTKGQCEMIEVRDGLAVRTAWIIVPEFTATAEKSQRCRRTSHDECDAE